MPPLAPTAIEWIPDESSLRLHGSWTTGALIPSEPSLTARLRREGMALLDNFEAASAELRTTLAAMRELVGGDNRDAIAAIVRDTATTSERLARAAGTFEDYLERLGPVLDQVAQTMEELPALAERGKKALDEAAAAAKAVRRATQSFDRLTAEAAPALSTLTSDALPGIAPLLRDLQDLTARLDRLAAELEQAPDLLLRGRTRRPGPGEGLP